MTPHLVLRPQAEAELLKARDWYEEQRPGLGEAFSAQVDTVFARIVQVPLSYARVQGETRRALMRQFPYAIYFHAMPDEIVERSATQHPRSSSVGRQGCARENSRSHLR